MRMTVRNDNQEHQAVMVPMTWSDPFGIEADDFFAFMDDFFAFMECHGASEPEVTDEDLDRWAVRLSDGTSLALTFGDWVVSVRGCLLVVDQNWVDARARP